VHSDDSHDDGDSDRGEKSTPGAWANHADSVLQGSSPRPRALEQHPLVVTPFLTPTFPWNCDVGRYENTQDLFDGAIDSYGLGVVPVGLVDGLPAGVQIVGDDSVKI
jgi:hypothetical protein